MDPMKEAQRIASEITGAPTQIRFVKPPRTRTGFSLNANIMGGHIALLWTRRLNTQAIAVHTGKVTLPLEALQGLQELQQAGVIVMTQGRTWLHIAMPDPVHRNTFSNWDGENQNRLSNSWENFWHKHVYDKGRNIRAV